MDRARAQSALTRLAAGDRDAFDEAFDELWPLIQAFAARHAPPGESDDVAQSALSKLFFRAAEFDPERDAVAWALGIVAWETRTHRRRTQRRRETALDATHDVVASDADSPEDAALASERGRLLDAMIAELSPADREAILLAAAGERPSSATFRKRLQRALARLRERWGLSHEG